MTERPPSHEHFLDTWQHVSQPREGDGRDKRRAKFGSRDDRARLLGRSKEGESGQPASLEGD